MSTTVMHVYRHRWTGKWEGHLWDPDAPRKAMKGGRARGKQVNKQPHCSPAIGHLQFAMHSEAVQKTARIAVNMLWRGLRHW